MPNGEDNAFPYLELGKMNLVSVKAVKKGGAEDVEEVDGKTVGVYEITAKFSQDLMTQQQNEEAKQTVEYIVKYIGVIEVKLVDIKYRKDYVWHDPHDNIPLALQLKVYRDRRYSNGVTFTDEYRSNLMAVDLYVSAHSWRGGIDEEIILPNGEKVFYHRSYRNTTDYGSGVTTKTRVSDIFAYTPEFIERLYEFVGESLNKYYNFSNGEYFAPSAPKAGWYSLVAGRRSFVRMKPKDEAFCMREYDIEVLFPDRFCYIKDNIDERMIDFFDREMTFDFDYKEQHGTTPEGYPARIIKRTCKTQFFGKEFNLSITDTLYQTTPLH